MAESSFATLQVRIESAPLAHRLALGLLAIVLGAVLLRSISLLGVLALAGGVWLIGRILPELRGGVAQNRTPLMQGALSFAFFAAALHQAWSALLPTLPLFAISVVLLPRLREAEPDASPRLSPLGREVVVALLLGVYALLLARDWNENAAAMQQRIVRQIPAPY